jgi:hypothetical protein
VSAVLLHLPLLAQRPRVRADCLPGGRNEARPCVWTDCRYSTADVRAHGRVAPSCVLDMTDGGGASCEEVGRLLGFSRSEVSLIAQTACAKPSVRDALREYRDHCGRPTDSALAQAAVRTGRIEGMDRSERYPGELVSVRLSVTKASSLPSSTRACAERAWQLYLEGRPCWEDRACVLRAGHAGDCVVPEDIRRARAGESRPRDRRLAG